MGHSHSAVAASSGQSLNAPTMSLDQAYLDQIKKLPLAEQLQLIEPYAKAVISQDPEKYFENPLIGAAIDGVLTGVVIALFFQWLLTSAHRDRWFTRILVAICAVSAVICTCMFIRAQVFYFAENFGHYAVEILMKWQCVLFWCAAAQTWPCQVFFIQRAWTLTGRKWWFFAGMCMLPLAECVLYTTFLILRPLTILDWSPLSLDLLKASYFTAGGTDLIITVIIVTALWRSRTGWTNTDKLIWRLCLLSFETQLLPCLVQLAFAIQIFIVPESRLFWYFICLPKISTIAVFVVLNSRDHLKRGIDAVALSDMGTNPNVLKLKGSTVGPRETFGQATVNIEIDQYIETSVAPVLSYSVNRPHRFQAVIQDPELALPIEGSFSSKSDQPFTFIRADSDEWMKEKAEQHVGEAI